MTGQFKVLSINVRGFNNKIEQNLLTSAIIKLPPDVLMLQETCLCKDTEPVIKTKTVGQQFQAIGTPKARGVSVFFSSKLHFN